MLYSQKYQLTTIVGSPMPQAYHVRMVVAIPHRKMVILGMVHGIGFTTLFEGFKKACLHVVSGRSPYLAHF